MILKRSLVMLAMVALATTVQADPSNESNRSTSSTTATTTSQKTFSLDNIGWRGWGVRAGFADDADQFIGGAHFNLGELANNLRFQPDVQLGTGDNVTTVYGTAPLYYRFPGDSRVTPYAGGGLVVGYVDVDSPAGSTADNSDIEFGARATGGVEWPRGGTEAFLLELSLGFGDVHDATVMAAWSF